ncbi:hypothetical protein ACX80H_09060 [Arthrobacter sp. MDT2-2]
MALLDEPTSVGDLTVREDGSPSAEVRAGVAAFGVGVIVAFSHFHDSAGSALAVSAERSLGGTLDAEDRNNGWDRMGREDPFIREKWAAIRSAGFSIRLESDTTVGDILGVALPLGTAIGLLVAGATNKVCGPYGSVKRDPYTHQDQPSVGFEVIIYR